MRGPALGESCGDPHHHGTRPLPFPHRAGVDHGRRLCGGLHSWRASLAAGGTARALPGRVGDPSSPFAGGGRRLPTGSVRSAVWRPPSRLCGSPSSGSSLPRSPPQAPRPLRSGQDVASGLDPAAADIGRSVGRARSGGGRGRRGHRPSIGGRRAGRAGRAARWSTWPAPSPPPSSGGQSAHFVDQAARRLQAVDPTIVAITGSFGKTSTKYHVAHSWSRPARWWPPRPASTTGRVWPGPSMSIWPMAPRSSSPKWAHTAPARSPTCAVGARLTSR